MANNKKIVDKTTRKSKLGIIAAVLGVAVVVVMTMAVILVINISKNPKITANSMTQATSTETQTPMTEQSTSKEIQSATTEITNSTMKDYDIPGSDESDSTQTNLFDNVLYQDTEWGMQYYIINGAVESFDSILQSKQFTWEDNNTGVKVNLSISTRIEHDKDNRLRAANTLVTRLGENGWRVQSSETNANQTLSVGINDDSGAMSYRYERIFEGLQFSLSADFPKELYDDLYAFIWIFDDSLSVISSNQPDDTTAVTLSPTQEPSQSVEESAIESNTNSGVDLSELTSVEAAVLARINQERALYNLQALNYDSGLTAVARARSQELNENDYFGHTRPDGQMWWVILEEWGIEYASSAEILANVNYSEYSHLQYGRWNNAEYWFNEWKNSPPHYATILENKYTHAGIGMDYHVSDGKYMFTIAGVFASYTTDYSQATPEPTPSPTKPETPVLEPTPTPLPDVFDISALYSTYINNPVAILGNESVNTTIQEITGTDYSYIAHAFENAKPTDGNNTGVWQTESNKLVIIIVYSPVTGATGNLTLNIWANGDMTLDLIRHDDGRLIQKRYNT